MDTRRNAYQIDRDIDRTAADFDGRYTTYPPNSVLMAILADELGLSFTPGTEARVLCAPNGEYVEVWRGDVGFSTPVFNRVV